LTARGKSLIAVLRAIVAGEPGAMFNPGTASVESAASRRRPQTAAPALTPSEA